MISFCACYSPSENPESPAASRSKSFSSEDAMLLVPNIEHEMKLGYK